MYIYIYIRMHNVQVVEAPVEKKLKSPRKIGQGRLPRGLGQAWPLVAEFIGEHLSLVWDLNLQVEFELEGALRFWYLFRCLRIASLGL